MPVMIENIHQRDAWTEYRRREIIRRRNAIREHKRKVLMNLLANWFIAVFIAVLLCFFAWFFGRIIGA